MHVDKGVFGLSLVWLLLTGCAGQPPAEAPDSSEPVTQVSALRAYAKADSRSSLLQAIRMLERYAASHPEDYESQARLANAYTLLGAGYTEDVSGKEAAYSAAIRYAEAAMMTEPGFAHVWGKRGVAFGIALQQLDHRHVEAMSFWKAALLYDYEECTGSMGKMLRYADLRRAVAVMDRLAQIDPNASWGNNLMTRGLYQLRKPDYVGGDVTAAKAMLDEAVKLNQRNLAPRWARAKFYAVLAGDRALFKRDLQWVAAQPLDDLLGYRPWNLLYQREARDLLKQTRQLFQS